MTINHVNGLRPMGDRPTTGRRNQSRIDAPTAEGIRAPGLRPTARPVDTYSRPEAPEQGNEWLSLANALGQINPTITNYLNEESARQQKDAEDRALRRIGGMSYEEARSAVDSGAISEMDNPWFKSAFMKVLGERTAYATMNTLSEQYATDPNRHEIDFSSYVRESASSDMEAYDDPHFNAGYLPLIGNFEASGAQKHTDVRSARAVEEASANIFGAFLGRTQSALADGKDPKAFAGELFASYTENEQFLRLDRNQQDAVMMNVISTIAEEGDWEMVNALLSQERTDEYGNASSLGASPAYSTKVAAIVEKAKAAHGEKVIEGDAQLLADLSGMASEGNLTPEYLKEWQEANPTVLSGSRPSELLAQSNRAKATAMEALATADQKAEWKLRGERDVQQVDLANLTAATGDGSAVYKQDVVIADGKGGSKVYTVKEQDDALSQSLQAKIEEYATQEGVTPEMALDLEVKLFATAGVNNARWASTLAGGVSQAHPANLKQFLDNGDAVLPPALEDGIKLYEELLTKSPGVLNRYFSNSDDREFFELVVAVKKHANAPDNYSAVRLAAQAQQNGKPNHPMVAMTHKEAEEALSSIKVGGWVMGINSSEPANAGTAMQYINNAMNTYAQLGVIGKPAQDAAIEQFKNTHVDINGYYVDVSGIPMENREKFSQSVDLVFSEVASDKARYLNGAAIEQDDLTLVPTSPGSGEWEIRSKATWGALPLAGVEPINLNTVAAALERKADIDRAEIEYQQRLESYKAETADANARPAQIEYMGRNIAQLENMLTSDHMQRTYGYRNGQAALDAMLRELPATIATRKAEMEQLKTDQTIFSLGINQGVIGVSPPTPQPRPELLNF